MNSALAIEEMEPLFGNDCAPAFLSSRPKEAARELSGSVNEVLTGMAFALEQMLLSTISKRTVAEYKAAFNEVFPKYVAVILALSRFAEAVIPADVIQRLTWEFFCEREADFRADGATVFGEAVRDQAMFTVWTLRKINDLIAQIRVAKKADGCMSDEEKEFARQYIINTLRANFSLESLGIALRQKCAIYPEVREEVTDALRAAVDAYAWVRRAYALCVPLSESPTHPTEWDEEDDELMQSSMTDFSDEEP